MRISSVRLAALLGLRLPSGRSPEPRLTETLLPGIAESLLPLLAGEGHSRLHSGETLLALARRKSRRLLPGKAGLAGHAWLTGHAGLAGLARLTWLSRASLARPEAEARE